MCEVTEVKGQPIMKLAEKNSYVVEIITHILSWCSIKMSYMTHSQMLQKVESDLPAKIGRLVGCTEMIS